MFRGMNAAWRQVEQQARGKSKRDATFKVAFKSFPRMNN